MRPPATTAGKLLPAALGLGLLLILATIGFRLAFRSGWPLGAYQAVVTASTLGDARLAPHSAVQYALIAGISLLGYAAWGLVIAVVTGTLVSVDMRALWGGPSVIERIGRLSGHTVIIGGGRVGRHVAEELRRHGGQVVILDRNEEVVRHLTEAGLLVLARDALEDGALAAAGLQRAAGAVLALPDDAQNLYVLLALRDAAPELRVVARAESVRAERHLRALGVERVVMPTALGGRRMARLLARPLSTAFLDTFLEEAGLEVREHPVAAGDPLEGRAVRDIRQLLGEAVTLLAIHRDAGFLTLPAAGTVIEPGDTLLLAMVAPQDAGR